MATPELGSKQICPNCQTKFYDLTRRPAHCPKCGLDFDPEEAVRSRRTRARTAAPDYDAEEPAEKPVRDEDQEGFEEEVEATPEIDEAAEQDAPVADDDEDADEAGAPSGGEEDLGAGFEEDEAEAAEEDDVPFLEDEDDDLGDDEIGLPEEEENDDR